MNDLHHTFIARIAEEMSLETAPVQKWTFKHRFNPDYQNYPHSCEDKNFGRNPRENIADLVKQEIGGEYQRSIGEQVASVVQKLYETYKVEMEQDGISKNDLKANRGGGKGENAPWRIAYRWLWEKKYFRWIQIYIWNNWKQRAQKEQICADWIEFCDRGGKGMKIPQSVEKENLPIDTPLSLKINVDPTGNYLLLFNRGLDLQGNVVGRYLVTPSQAFAPSYQLTEKITWLPLEDAMCEDIEFDSSGEEEYIGIVIDRPLDLPWLIPTKEDPAMEWEGKHLEEVWKQLRDKDNWQVLYQNFKVGE